MRPGWREHPDGEAGQFRVPDEARPAWGRLERLDRRLSVSRSAMAILSVYWHQAEIFSAVFRQCIEVPRRAAKCNSIPCTSAKNDDETGIFGGRGKFFGSVNRLEKRPPTDCKTVYSGSIPDVASNSLSRQTKIASATRRRCTLVDLFGTRPSGLGRTAAALSAILCYAAKYWCYAAIVGDYYGIPAYISV